MHNCTTPQSRHRRRTLANQYHRAKLTETKCHLPLKLPLSKCSISKHLKTKGSRISKALRTLSEVSIQRISTSTNIEHPPLWRRRWFFAEKASPLTSLQRCPDLTKHDKNVTAQKIPTHLALSWYKNVLKTFKNTNKKAAMAESHPRVSTRIPSSTRLGHEPQIGSSTPLLASSTQL